MSKLEIPPTEFAQELISGNVKAAMKSLGASSSDLWKVEPAKLRRLKDFNGRIRTPAYLEHLASIKESIRENGYYPDKPLAGYVAKDDDGSDVVYVTEGHTRFEAVDELIAEGVEFGTIPVVIKPKGTTMEDLTIALVTSNEGRPFTTYEKALMVKRLVGMGMDEATIAKRLSFKTGKAYVDDLLLLAGAPKAVRDLLIADKIAATMAIAELKASGPKAAERLKAAVDTAAEKGKAKASPKHLEKPAGKPKKAKVAPTPSPEAEKPALSATDALLDAQNCGLDAVDDEGKLLKFAATILARFGIEVYDEVAEEPKPDPASDL